MRLHQPHWSECDTAEFRAVDPNAKIAASLLAVAAIGPGPTSAKTILGSVIMHGAKIRIPTGRLDDIRRLFDAFDGQPDRRKCADRARRWVDEDRVDLDTMVERMGRLRMKIHGDLHGRLG